MRNRFAAAVALVAITSWALAAAAPAPTKPPMSPQWAAEKAQLIALGKQYPNAAAFYADLKKKANGGKRLAWNALPDWRGIYSRPLVGGIFFDTDQEIGGLPTAKYTPEYQKRLK